MSRDYLSETEMLMSFVKQVENLWANVAKNVPIKESKCCKMDSLQLHTGRCTRRRVANDNLRCVKQRKCAIAVTLKIRRDEQDGDWQASGYIIIHGIVTVRGHA